MRIFLGIIMIFCGMLIAVKANWLVRNLGYSEFGETKMRSYGGTRLLWKLIGITVIIAGTLVITDLHGDIVLWVFGSLFNGIRQTPGY